MRYIRRDVHSRALHETVRRLEASMLSRRDLNACISSDWIKCPDAVLTALPEFGRINQTLERVYRNISLFLDSNVAPNCFIVWLAARVTNKIPTKLFTAVKFIDPRKKPLNVSRIHAPFNNHCFKIHLQRK